MSDTKNSLLIELADYETKLTGIENRFKETRERIRIAEGDSQLLLQIVRELIDLLDSALGKPNDYSQSITACYKDGQTNFYNSQSLQSVHDIIALVKAAQTHIKRPTTILREVTTARREGTKVFIGHGHSKEWLALKDFIEGRMRLEWDEFNRVATAGVSTAERLKKMLDEATIAFLILTAEDETADGEWQARMNVIHEAGLFQGRLGFNRAIVMLEEGCKEFSNIHGLGQIGFPKSNIRAAFHDVELVLEREGIIRNVGGE